MSLPIEQSRDLWLSGGEITPEGREATGTLALCQRLERALNTDRDFFPYRHMKNRGYNVPANLLSNTPLFAIRTNIEEECKRDEQVSDAAAVIVRNPDGTLSTTVAIASPPLGNFTFTMSVTDAAATLLTLEQQNG